MDSSFHDTFYYKIFIGDVCLDFKLWHLQWRSLYRLTSYCYGFVAVEQWKAAKSVKLLIIRIFWMLTFKSFFQNLSERPCMLHIDLTWVRYSHNRYIVAILTAITGNRTDASSLKRIVFCIQYDCQRGQRKITDAMQSIHVMRKAVWFEFLLIVIMQINTALCYAIRFCWFEWTVETFTVWITVSPKYSQSTLCSLLRCQFWVIGHSDYLLVCQDTRENV